jgi:hypothetical protein
MAGSRICAKVTLPLPNTSIVSTQAAAAPVGIWTTVSFWVIIIEVERSDLVQWQHWGQSEEYDLTVRVDVHAPMTIFEESDLNRWEPLQSLLRHHKKGKRHLWRRMQGKKRKEGWEGDKPANAARARFSNVQCDRCSDCSISYLILKESSVEVKSRSRGLVDKDLRFLLWREFLNQPG